MTALTHDFPYRPCCECGYPIPGHALVIVSEFTARHAGCAPAATDLVGLVGLVDASPAAVVLELRPAGAERAEVAA